MFNREGFLTNTGIYKDKTFENRSIKPDDTEHFTGFLETILEKIPLKTDEKFSIQYTPEHSVVSIINNDMGKDKFSEYLQQFFTVDSKYELTKGSFRCDKTSIPIKKVNHIEFLEGITEIYNRILDKESFDTIVAISRSGYVPATYLAYKLGIENVHSVCAHVFSKHRNKVKQNSFSEKPELVEGKKILLVDSVMDSGVSLEKNKAFINKFSPQTIDSAVLHYLPTSKFVPSYSYRRLPVCCWVSYEWDR